MAEERCGVVAGAWRDEGQDCGQGGRQSDEGCGSVVGDGRQEAKLAAGAYSTLLCARHGHGDGTPPEGSRWGKAGGDVGRARAARCWRCVRARRASLRALAGLRLPRAPCDASARAPWALGLDSDATPAPATGTQRCSSNLAACLASTSLRDTRPRYSSLVVLFGVASCWRRRAASGGRWGAGGFVLEPRRACVVRLFREEEG